MFYKDPLGGEGHPDVAPSASPRSLRRHQGLPKDLLTPECISRIAANWPTTTRTA